MIYLILKQKKFHQKINKENHMIVNIALVVGFFPVVNNLWMDFEEDATCK